MSLKGLFIPIKGFAQIAEIDPLLLVICTQLFLGTMKIDRGIMACFTQKLDHPLCLAKRIGANDMRPVWLCGQRCQQTRDFILRVWVLKHR